MIDNTSESMQDPANRLLFFAASMGPGGSDQAVAEQERAGQAQLVNSDRLPTDLNGDQTDFEALGFVFGERDPRDPLFRSATLPEGWKREASDHSMGSYVVDGLGRRRVSIFYKAAFYDRRADMTLVSVSGYVRDRVHHGSPIVTDDTWATPAAVARALGDLAQRAQDDVNTWEEIAERRGDDHFGAGDRVAEYTATRDKYTVLAATFEAVTEA